MRAESNPSSAMASDRISRRTVLSVPVVAFSIVPARVLGRGGSVPPSEKLNLAFVGTGGRGSINIPELKSQNIVAICDVDWRSRPNKRGALDVAQVCGGAKRYDDWRIMLQEQEKNIDGVVVSAPDHHHAPASLMAMRMGKHVYCEKPLAHSIDEVRAMVAAARKYKVTTQTGNQGHSSEDLISIVEWVRDGAIGDVKEVSLFLRPGEPDVEIYRQISNVGEQHAIPPELKWDLWLGAAPARPYNPMYLPERWRSWRDFGSGATGDFNCHFMDAPFWALDLGMPETIEAETHPEFDPRTNRQTFAHGFDIRYRFPARGSKPPVVVNWLLRRSMPKLPEGWDPNEKLPSAGGGILYGTTGAIVFGPIYASRPRSASTGQYKPVPWGTPYKVRIFPQELDRAYKRPDPTLPRPVSHWIDWVESAKAGKLAGSDFSYGGALTEIGHLGNLACLFKGTVLHFDAQKGRISNHNEANKLFGRQYRKGWSL